MVSKTTQPYKTQFLQMKFGEGGYNLFEAVEKPLEFWHNVIFLDEKCANCEEMLMAAIQGVNNMTLNQQEKMYNVIPSNCVIVNNAYGQSANSVIQGKRALAPAPERNTVLINNSDIRCKRKIQFIPHSGPNIQPASVARRNARERNRVKQVNNGFAALRQHIPSTVLSTYSPQNGAPATGRGANKKLSKVETLKMAVEYIRSLQQMLEDHEAEMSSKSISDSNISENRFYTNSPDSITQQFTNYPLILPTPPASESSSSPTPSHTSESSATPPGRRRTPRRNFLLATKFITIFLAIPNRSFHLIKHRYSSFLDPSAFIHSKQ
ncbi:hypothetical protein RN001_004150 [Aquatica leii]|uniref:BHLH domain-containing protein n=1 Tax=Aquatica leii TaxID=1421715 RepID=A0AAN7SMN6_9COLE|nr:hypothetical protein RN001_004150 [Aquatica leii]